MPTSRRRVVTQRKRRPPVAHCRRTVAASRRITRRVSHRVSDPDRHGKERTRLKVTDVTAEIHHRSRFIREERQVLNGALEIAAYCTLVVAMTLLVIRLF